jgi:hypothetical protein
MTLMIAWTSPQFMYEDGIFYAKPYPSYPTWLIAWDATALVPLDITEQLADINDAIDAIADTNDAQDIDISAIESVNTTQTTNITAAAAAAAAAQTTANTAAAAAAAAQTTANTAVSSIAALQYNKTIDLFADSAIVSGGTPTYIENTVYRYNYVRYTTVINAQFDWYFDADLSLGASINVLYVSGTGSGNIDLSINGTYIASKDFSTGGANNKALWTQALGASIHGKGRHTIRLKCGGAGSVGSAFAMSITKVWINAT